MHHTQAGPEAPCHSPGCRLAWLSQITVLFKPGVQCWVKGRRWVTACPALWTRQTQHCTFCTQYERCFLGHRRPNNGAARHEVEQWRQRRKGALGARPGPDQGPDCCSLPHRDGGAAALLPEHSILSAAAGPGAADSESLRPSRNPRIRPTERVFYEMKPGYKMNHLFIHRCSKDLLGTHVGKGRGKGLEGR